MEYVFVIGEAGSGKSTFVESHKRMFRDPIIIEFGNIVREITKTENRVFSNDLDEEIYKECFDKVIRYRDTQRSILFVAPRSAKLMDKLVSLIGKMNINIIYLDVPYEIREGRFNEAHRDKDNGMSYSDVIARDNSLGMEEVIDKTLKGEYGYCTVLDENFFCKKTKGIK